MRPSHSTSLRANGLPWWAVLVVAFGGVAVGVLVARAGPSRPASRSQAATSSNDPSVSEPPRAIVVPGADPARIGEADRLALRAMMREELQSATKEAAQRASADASVQKAVDTKALVEQLSTNERRAYDAAESMVDDRITQGVWTEEDRTHLRENMAGLPVPLVLAIVQPLVEAVNKGEVRFGGRGPLF